MRFKYYSYYIAAGAGAYWVPDILIHWTLTVFSHKIWIAFLTLLVPIIVFVTFFLLRKSPTHRKYPLGLPLFMLLGIWLLGPLAIAISVQPLGGSFLSSGNLKDFFILWYTFPMSTFMMSTYSGSLGGLLITSLILLIFTVIGGLGYLTSLLHTTTGNSEP